MAELRKNPFKNDWVMIASHRQNRPQMPKDWCPFCPGSGRVPEHFDVYKYDNDFPALSQTPPEPDDVASDFFETAPCYGKCEVILYSPEHTITLPELSEEHVLKLVELWRERFAALSDDKNIKYIMIFENRGELVGVTMPHPHGQIYGYGRIPKKCGDELFNSAAYHEKTGRCLHCDWLENERADGRRIIFEDEHFTCVLPFFSETVYGIQLVARRHVNDICQLTPDECVSLARAVRSAAGTLDSLFDERMPYMMFMHQAPVNSEGFDPMCSHFHVEFVPLLRSKGRQQFFASSETGAWAHCNPTAPEEKAIELREAYKKFNSR